MKVYSLHYKQIVNRPLDDVFDFFSNPENLSVITPKKLNFTILTPCPIKMKDGQLIDYTITLLGKKIRWRTMITAFEPPKMFIDQQLKGPYSMWHHKHSFKEVKNGVEIIDTIHYSVPFGFLGDIINFLFIRRDLENIFKHRKVVIERYFKSKEI